MKADADKVMDRIKNEISFEQSNTIRNHMLNFFRRESAGYYGFIRENEFVVWRKSSLTSAFYTVIKGKIEVSGTKPKVTFSASMNSFGVLLFLIIVGLFAYGITIGTCMPTDISWTFLWKRILTGLMVSSLPVLALSMGYRFGRKAEIRNLKEILSGTRS